MTGLEEYRINRPLTEIFKAKEQELARAKIRILDMSAKMHKMEYEWRISQHEFQLVNSELGRFIESAELYNLAKELVRHPSKYVDIIRTMRERSELPKLTNSWIGQILSTSIRNTSRTTKNIRFGSCTV
jgi:hypothetical protein